MSNNVMNIVNFVRGCEPRKPKDLYTPVAQEIAVNRENGLKSTFLLQYDAIFRNFFCGSRERIWSLDCGSKCAVR